MLSTSEPTFADLAAALAKAQGSFPAIKKEHVAKVRGESKHGEPVEFSYGYADLADILDAIRKPLSENGLSIIQPIVPSDPEHVLLVTRLLHSSGQWIESAYPIDVYEKPQEMGSAITYARRYALTALLGIAAEEDDDGQTAQGSSRAARTETKRPACPQCGKTAAVIKGKEEFGGGWLCFAKKGGCGARWQAPVEVELSSVDVVTVPSREPGSDDEAPPSKTAACAHCGSVTVEPDPKAPGWLVCGDCHKGTKRG